MTIWLEDGLKNQDQSVETASGKLVTPSESHSDDVWKFVTPSGSAIIKEALETLAWRCDESAHEEMNESCLMAFGSQEGKRTLQHETNKLASRAKDLLLEFDEIKGIKTKEVVEPCLSCEKLTHVVDSLKDDVLRLEDEALSFLKFKKSSDTLDHM
ncbi:hypothetical protein Tco_0240688 [Tanacetum coccineum]